MIQHEGGRHIDFRQNVYLRGRRRLRLTTANGFQPTCRRER